METVEVFVKFGTQEAFYKHDREVYEICQKGDVSFSRGTFGQSFVAFMPRSTANKIKAIDGMVVKTQAEGWP